MSARALRSCCAAVAALSLLAGAAASASASVLPPASDPFYAQAPTAGPPGTIVSSRPVQITVLNSLGVPLPLTAWQIAYDSRDASNGPVVDVGTLIEPAIGGPARPLVSYDEAEDSDTQSCSPSYTLASGSFPELNTLLLPLAAGWDVMVPDYEGPNSEFGAGPQEGHGILDGLRAAESFAPAGLSSSTEVGIWGYSGGGFATAWASELQPAYAPGLNLKGIAEGGVPSNMPYELQYSDGNIGAGFYPALMTGLDRAYSLNVHALLNAPGLAAYGQISGECSFTYAAQYPYQSMEAYTTSGLPLTTTSAAVSGAVAAQVLGGHPPHAPLFYYHAILDELVPFSEAQHLVSTYCTAHVAPVDFDQVLVGEHATAGQSEAPAAVAFLTGQFLGLPAPHTC